VSDSAASARFALLRAVGRVADGPGLLGETVQQLLDLIVPAFADVATLDVTAATGEMRRLGARLERPRSRELEAALLSRRQSGDTSVGVLHTVATGESQLLAPLTHSALATIATGEEDLAMLESLDLRATIYVPLSARGRTLGVLSCSVRGEGRSFSEADLHFAEALGSRIGLALDNAGLSATVSSLERQLEAAMANLAAAVVVRDASGRMIFANAAAAELFRAESVEGLFGMTSEQLMALFSVTDADGRPVCLGDLPASAALRGERPEAVTVRSVLRSTGTVRWLTHKARPVFDEDGTVSLVVNVIEDVTDAKRAELAQRLLADASRALSGSLDVEQTLQHVASIAVPGLADWCGVSVRGTTMLEPVAVAHADPDRVALVRRWVDQYPTRLEARSGAPEVLRTGRPQLVAEITDEVIAASAASEEQLALVRELGMRSVIIVPLVVAGREPFGTLSLVMAESGRRFDVDDLSVAEELGRRAATALETARLYTERSRVAATLQHGLLPPPLPDPPGFHLATLYRPAGEDSEVGGDFYDGFAMPGGWMVAVGDVTGHGATAAALTSLSRHTLRTAARLLGDVVAAAERLNTELLELPELALVTLCAVMLRQFGDRAAAEVLLAGHPPAVLIRDGRPHEVGSPVPLLGFDDRGPWATTSVDLEPADLLVLYTDGVVDTFRGDERFGETRLMETLKGAHGAEDVIARIDSALGAFAAGAQRDDTAVVVIERLGVHAPTVPSGVGGAVA
jgi:PAS domain S-box-containing protein